MCWQCYLVYTSASFVYMFCSVVYFSMGSVVSTAKLSTCVDPSSVSGGTWSIRRQVEYIFYAVLNVSV